MSNRAVNLSFLIVLFLSYWIYIHHNLTHFKPKEVLGIYVQRGNWRIVNK